MRLARVVAWGAAGALGIGGLVGVAGATSGSPGGGSAAAGTVQTALPVAESGSAAAGADDGGQDRARRGVLRRVEHGEFVVRTKDGHRTFHVQRGTLTAANATSVTVKSADGFSQTWAINGDTKIRKQGKDVPAGSLEVGDRVRVVGPESDGGVTARHLRVRVPKATGSDD